jgi:CDP-glycerol glycerophosphotransferase (TagB/SpsB family)
VVRRVEAEICFVFCCLFLIVRPLLRFFINKPVWLVAEKENEARDNGIAFFHYLKTTDVERNVYYVIKPDSYDLKNVGRNPFVKYRSLKHYFLFAVSECLISSQMHTAIPYASVNRTGIFKILGRNLCIVFLQHGVIKDSFELFTQSRTKIDLFICSSQAEYKYLKANCGYDKGHGKLILTGLPRFDRYELNQHQGVNNVLIFPTFRKWLVSGSGISKNVENTEFNKSRFFRFYDNLINDPELDKFLSSSNVSCSLYLHYAMQKFEKYFKTRSPCIDVIDSSNVDIRDLILQSDVLITDRSSLAFDFAYMLKPVVYVNFDWDDFEKYHYRPGYFDIHRHGFGPVCYDSRDVLCALHDIASNQGKMSEPYLSRARECFPFRDQRNSERVHSEIKNFLRDMG